MEGKAADIKKAQEADERSRSAIKFPYGDLNDAIAVAQAVWDNAGEECTRSQLAAFLNQTPTSGAYRLKLATASNFNLVKSSQGKVRLTDLGKAIVDPQKSTAARVKSFYAIPLYKTLYDRFDGHTLPPTAALERVMVDMGVPPKQSDIARQVFQRAAQQAGFFAHGNNRLVEPIVREGGTPSGGGGAKGADSNAGNGGGGSKGATGGGGGGAGGGGGSLDPFIQGLLSKLPASGTAWESKDQVKWLQTAATIFNLVYGGDEEIEVRLKRNEH